MGDNVNLTKRVRRRRQKDGRVIPQLRYVVNYREPKTGKRRQEFFERQKEAQARQAELQSQLHSGSYFDARRAPTVAAAVDHYLAERSGKVKASTLEGYRVVVQHIEGPLLVGSAKQRAAYSRTGHRPEGTKFVQALGNVKVSELTTAEIRQWHGTVAEISGDYTANRAASHLKAVLGLAEEDFRVRGPAMPRNLARARQKQRKTILTPSQVGALLAQAKQDPEHGIYYAFPFLAGTRPSEQLGLLWEDVDFEKNVIRIRRILERDGTAAAVTKTEAGTRDIPMMPSLREMLLEWRIRCPRLKGELHRVFPGPGRRQIWPLPRTGGGGPLLYWNFLKRFWKPAFAKAALPYVTPHSARHCLISTMQAQGIEVGLVARLAGHANPTVTLGHYTQAVRGGEEAVKALEAAYTAQQVSR